MMSKVPNEMKLHVQYERSMVTILHQLLTDAGTAAFGTGAIRNAMHEAFYVHWLNLMTYYQKYHVHLPNPAEFYDIQDRVFVQILRLGSRRCDTRPLQTPDATAFDMLERVLLWAEHAGEA